MIFFSTDNKEEKALGSMTFGGGLAQTQLISIHPKISKASSNKNNVDASKAICVRYLLLFTSPLPRCVLSAFLPFSYFRAHSEQETLSMRRSLARPQSVAIQGISG